MRDKSEKINSFANRISWLKTEHSDIYTHIHTQVKVFGQSINIEMDADEFRKFGYAAIDFVADYLENIRERFVHKFQSEK